MKGVRTDVSDPKINTAWTTALKKKPDTLGYAPSQSRILVIYVQLFGYFIKFLTTAGQLSSPAIITHTRYLNEVIVSNGFLLAWKALSILSRI